MNTVSTIFLPTVTFPSPDSPLTLTDFIALLQRVQASIDPKIYSSQFVYGLAELGIEGVRKVTEAEVHAVGYEKAVTALQTLAAKSLGLTSDEVKGLLTDITATQTPSPKV